MAIDFRPKQPPALDFAPKQPLLPQTPKEPSAYEKISESMGEFSEGFTKDNLSFLKGAGTIGQTVLDQTAGRVVNAIEGKGFVPTGPDGTISDLYRKGSTVSNSADKFLETEGTAQKLGAATAELAQFFIPAGKAMKAERSIDLLTKGMTSPLFAAATRVVGKGLIQGAAAGGIKFVQTGGDAGESAKVGIGAGVFRGGIATIGEGARALRIPERLYSMIFRNTASDMMDELKTETLVNLYKTQPEKYAALVKQGIITETEGGPQVNATIAKQALDMGLKGSIRNMAKSVVEGTLDSESQVRTLVANYKGTVDLSEPQFQKILTKISSQYQDVGFNEISDEAARLAGVIKDSKGAVDAITALDVRRLLDRARIASSFDRGVMELSLGQSNLKTLADAARKRVNAIPGMGDVMGKYSFYIDAMETLAKEAARRGNNQALSLIDSLFLSSAFGADNYIPGLTAGMVRKLFMSGKGTTMLAGLLNKSAASTPMIGTTGAAASGLTSLLTPPQQ